MYMNIKMNVHTCTYMNTKMYMCINNEQLHAHCTLYNVREREHEFVHEYVQ